MDLELAQRGNKAYKPEYEKEVYYFTSAEQKATFDRNPKKYLPQYGWLLCFWNDLGAKSRVDPNKIIVKDRKYFLYLNDVELDAKGLWLSEKNHKRFSVHS